MLMKCYRCGRTIPESLDHCIYCEAKLKPDLALIKQALKDDLALTELYQMLCLRFYNHFLKCGIKQEAVPQLTQTAFLHLLDHIREVNDEASFETLVTGILEDESYRYMVEHPGAYDASYHQDVYVQVTKAMIDEMLKAVDRTRFLDVKSEISPKRDVGLPMCMICLYIFLLVSLGSVLK